MERNDHLIRRTKAILVCIASIMCAGLLCSCGNGSNPRPEPSVKILWNQNEETYLLPDEVVDARSGELRIKASGRYLDRAKWEEK
ncbi:MAG: hypothetical protein K9N51_08895, partial [Candidatus Pacebacteria bacterium]|nr:hypothetical protein [Candidatus Paceibacterota bacterium]